MTISRPVLRWHGGKWMLAPWIIQHMPAHRAYVEPFGGAASVLLRKKRSHTEVYNDLDDDVVNLFRVLRDARQARWLVRALRLTPFAATEFADAYLDTDEPVEKARRLVIRSFMGWGSNAHFRKTGFRANSNQSGTTPARDWSHYPTALATIVDRLSGVTITCRDALSVMAAHDAATTLHYVDPPYLMATRADARADYRHEMTDSDHLQLLSFLKTLKGRVLLSGYENPIYAEQLAEWHRTERDALADGAAKRTEVLWANFEPPSQPKQGALL